MPAAQPSDKTVARQDPPVEPVIYDPRVGAADPVGGVFGLRGQDPTMEYCWAATNRSGQFSVAYMRQAGYEVQRYGDLDYEFKDPLNPPTKGAPIEDGDLVLLGRKKEVGEYVREHGFRTVSGQAGGMQANRNYESIRDRKLKNASEDSEAFIKVGKTGAIEGSLPH